MGGPKVRIPGGMKLAYPVGIEPTHNGLEPSSPALEHEGTHFYGSEYGIRTHDPRDMNPVRTATPLIRVISHLQDGFGPPFSALRLRRFVVELYYIVVIRVVYTQEIPGDLIRSAASTLRHAVHSP